MSRKIIDLTGIKFGKLTVITRADNTADGQLKWLCRCDCGNTYVAQGRFLKSGATKSCGCLSKGRMKQGEMTNRDMIQPSDSLTRLELTQNPYQNLANAIIAVAADDYRTALKTNDSQLKKSLENFFRSGWYKTLTRISPDILMDSLHTEFHNNLKAISA